MTRAIAKAIKDRIGQVVHIENPPSTSAANLVLLARHYFVLDRSIYSESRMGRIRKKWMNQQVKNAGKDGLTCAICGRKKLRLDPKNKNKLATLDHIVSINDGGSWDDPNNFQVACFLCNSNKEKNLSRNLTSE